MSYYEALMLLLIILLLFSVVIFFYLFIIILVGNCVRALVKMSFQRLQLDEDGEKEFDNTNNNEYELEANFETENEIGEAYIDMQNEGKEDNVEMEMGNNGERIGFFSN